MAARAEPKDKSPRDKSSRCGELDGDGEWLDEEWVEVVTGEGSEKTERTAWIAPSIPA
jgi:phage terminase large subunit-like protein